MITGSQKAEGQERNAEEGRSSIFFRMFRRMFRVPRFRKRTKNHFRIPHMAQSQRLNPPRQQGRAAWTVLDDDVLMFGVRACAINAESVECGHAHRRGEVPSRSSADNFVSEFESELRGQCSRVFVERDVLFRTRHRRTIYGARYFDLRAGKSGLESANRGDHP